MSYFVSPRHKDRCAVMNALWLQYARQDLASVALDERLVTAEFLYVPIWQAHHWVGAIVCRSSVGRYRVLVVDSLRGKGSPLNIKPHCALLTEILRMANAIHGSALSSVSVDAVMVEDSPVQPNLVDCALYMTMCFSKHSAILPNIHAQDSPKWDGALSFRHPEIQQMRRDLHSFITQSG